MALVVNPGTPATLEAGIPYTLSGSASGGAAPYSYRWTPPAGITLSDATVTNPTTSAFPQSATAQNFVFTLTVTDSLGASASSTVTITIAAATEFSLTATGWVPYLTKRIGGAAAKPPSAPATLNTWEGDNGATWHPDWVLGGSAPGITDVQNNRGRMRLAAASGLSGRSASRGGLPANNEVLMRFQFAPSGGAGAGNPGLATWRTALTNRNTTPAKILAIGDSRTEGEGATTLAARWMQLVAGSLRSSNPTTGNPTHAPINYVPISYVSPTLTALSYWSSVSSSSAPNNYGLGQKAITMTATGHGGTLTFTGTSCKVEYTQPANLAGSFTYSVDGGAATTVTYAAGGAVSGLLVSVSGLTAGTHTVDVRWASGTVTLNGAQIFNGEETKGIQFFDGGRHGTNSSLVVGAGATYWRQSIASVNPHLVIIGLGVNDQRSNVAPATYKANMLARIADVRAACTTNPSIVLTLDWGQGSITPTYQWSEYLQQLRDIVAADNTLTVFDLQASFPLSSDNSLGYYTSGLVHETNAGQNARANLLTPFLNEITGSSAEKYLYIEQRYVSTTSGVTLELSPTTYKIFNTGGAALATVNTTALQDGLDRWIRFRVNGTSAQVRIWKVGDVEPATWDITQTVTATGAGSLVLTWTSGVAATTADVFFDDLSITAIEAPPTATLIALTDDFSTDDLTTRWNAVGSGVVVTNGLLQITPSTAESGRSSKLGYNMQDKSVFVKLNTLPTVEPTGSAYAEMAFYLNLTHDLTYDRIGFSWINGSLKMIEAVNGAWAIQTAITYNATNHKFLQVRVSGSTVYWEAAPDNGSNSPGAWTVLYSKLVATQISAMKVFLTTKVSTGTLTNPIGVSEFDNVNATAAATPRALTDIPNYFVELHADDLTNLASGAEVGLTSANAHWTARRGTATAVGTTSTARPIKTTLGGKVCVSFDPTTSDRLDGTGDLKSFANGITGCTIFVVSYPTGAAQASSQRMLSFLVTTSNLARVTMQRSSTGIASPGVAGGESASYRTLDADASINPRGNVAMTQDGWNITCADRDFTNAVSQMFHNGTSVYGPTTEGTAGTTTATDSNQTLIGGGAGSNYWAGGIRRIIIFNRKLTTAERAKVHSILQDEESITVSDYVAP